MNRKKAVLLGLVSSALLGTAAYADFGGRGGHEGGRFGGPGFGMPHAGMFMGRMADHLDLDDAQRESVKNIWSAAEPEMTALREKFQANREALGTLDASDPEIQNIAISNGELATEGTLLFARIRSEMDAVLTDEQRAKVAEFKENRKERKFDRRERREDRR